LDCLQGAGEKRDRTLSANLAANAIAARHHDDPVFFDFWALNWITAA